MGRNFWVDAGSQGFLGPGSWAAGAIRPRIDIVESDREILVYAELAGVSEKDIQLSMGNGVLTIAGEKRPQNQEEWQQSHYLAERAFGAFRRSVNLPAGLDEDAAEASFADGVLTVRLPKLVDTIPKGKSIPIKPR